MCLPGQPIHLSIGRAVLAIAVGFGLSGCVEPMSQRLTDQHTKQKAAMSDGTLSDMCCLIPVNYLSATPWRVYLLGKTEAATVLSQSITLQPGSYTIEALSREVSRATGKAIIWNPALHYRKQGTGLDHFRVVAAAQGGLEIPANGELGDVLGGIAAAVTELGVYPANPGGCDSNLADRPNNYPVWVVFFTAEAIIFTELPAGEK